ncbi:MAG: DUF2809 domain-containing protein [Clostridia bacterium]|nr:DUF2809 domain-containing protein [Clostridia bacterium]
MNKITKRILFAVSFLFLLGTEVLIALYAHDDFIRPFVGDMIVTVVVFCFVRIFIPDGVKLMSLYVMLFAVAVEIGQYFNYVELLGFQDNPIISTAMGTSFAWEDIACYAVGCIACAVFDFARFRKSR